MPGGSSGAPPGAPTNLDATIGLIGAGLGSSLAWDKPTGSGSFGCELECQDTQGSSPWVACATIAPTSSARVTHIMASVPGLIRIRSVQNGLVSGWVSNGG